jgi:hypothetical protein
LVVDVDVALVIVATNAASATENSTYCASWTASRQSRARGGRAACRVRTGVRRSSAYGVGRRLFFEPGGRPAPRRRRRRPFLAGVFGAKAPRKPAIACRTSS